MGFPFFRFSGYCSQENEFSMEPKKRGFTYFVWRTHVLGFIKIGLHFLVFKSTSPFFAFPGTAARKKSFPGNQKIWVRLFSIENPCLKFHQNRASFPFFIGPFPFFAFPGTAGRKMSFPGNEKTRVGLIHPETPNPEFHQNPAKFQKSSIFRPPFWKIGAEFWKTRKHVKFLFTFSTQIPSFI